MILTVLLNSLLAGMFWLAAGLCGLTRHFLLEPRLVGYPKSKEWLQNVFFVYASCLIFVGLRFLTIWYTGEANVSPPGATSMGVFIAAITLIYKSSLLADTISKWRPQLGA